MRSLVVPDADVMPRDAEGTPRYVEPAIAREELVGEFVSLEEIYQALELSRVVNRVNYQVQRRAR